ncbi:hypothetical protein JTE90_029116 [Oedothorax gibbosus]|uniref:RNA helicase n=1 Tax=Oedothorax gibbosus TaxID=931172 RepID=A0AAV6V831_9ARAC|nr:hypothetical protein JTE90_029116 [Oedothorax gibbosus]
MYSDRIIASLKRSIVASKLSPYDTHSSTFKNDNNNNETIKSVDRVKPMAPQVKSIDQLTQKFDASFGVTVDDTSNQQFYSSYVNNTTKPTNDSSNQQINSSIAKNNMFNMLEMEEEPDISDAEVSLMRKVLRTQLVHSSHEVEVLRQDVNSPLHSVKKFEELNLSPQLLKGVYAMGFNAPSKIQETTLPALIAEPPANMIAQSQSGTGKTATFVLSCLSRVKPELQYPQVLILSPTNELAYQTGQVAMQMGQFCTGIEFRYAMKGELQKGHPITEQVLIGTPGKVYDWSRKRGFFDLNLITCFVLDEADIMISLQGHMDQCMQIHRYMSETCQTMLFSATYNTEVMEFAEMIILNPIIIRLKREEEFLINVKQYYIECYTLGQKYASICNIYGVVSIGQVIIFCKTKWTAAGLGAKLAEDGHSVGYLSSDLDIKQRLHVLKRFRDGKEKVLITTNVCARGIDIEQVTLVINFDLPVTKSGQADCETYLHRIGRSGRFGKRGLAVNMVADDKDLKVIRSIEEHFGIKIHKLDSEDLDQLEDAGK